MSVTIKFEVVTKDQSGQDLRHAIKNKADSKTPSSKILSNRGLPGVRTQGRTAYGANMSTFGNLWRLFGRSRPNDLG